MDITTKLAMTGQRIRDDNTVVNIAHAYDPVDEMFKAKVKTDGRDYTPQYSSSPEESQNISTDPDGNLMVRGGVTTDARSYRVNFSGASLLLSMGECTFTNGSRTVTGTGFSEIDLHTDNYVKLDSDADTYFAQVEHFTDTEITLYDAYAGTSGTGNASCAQVKFIVAPTDTFSLANSTGIITKGNTINSVTEIERDVDVLPIVMQTAVSVSQRVANQNTYVGLYDEAHADTPFYYAWFRFDGTTNTTLKCESAFNRNAAPSGGEIELTTITLPDGLTTAMLNRYRVELTGFEVVFYINDKVVATHTKSMPRFVDLLTSSIRVVNGGTAPTAGTVVSVDYMVVNNHEFFTVNYSSKSTKVQTELADELKVANTSVTSATTLFTQDVGKYPYVDVQVTSPGTTCTITYEHSNDGTNWVPVAMMDAAATNSAGTTTSTAAGHYTGYIPGKYFRARVSTYTSGTVTANMIARPNGLYQRGSLTVTASNLPANVAQWAGTNGLNGGVAGSVGIGGLAAHDAAVSGNPVRQGGRALTANYTAVATGDTADFVTTLNGAQIVKPFSIPEADWQYATPIATPIVNTTAVALKAAGAAGIRNYITGLQYQNTSAVPSIVTVQDGTTVIWTGYAPANMTAPANITFQTPLKGTAATAMNFVVNTTATNTFVSAQGYQAA